jgi:hypothetical protein
MPGFWRRSDSAACDDGIRHAPVEAHLPATVRLLTDEGELREALQRAAAHERALIERLARHAARYERRQADSGGPSGELGRGGDVRSTARPGSNNNAS